jgi:hypothetical protein
LCRWPAAGLRIDACRGVAFTESFQKQRERSDVKAASEGITIDGILMSH